MPHQTSANIILTKMRPYSHCSYFDTSVGSPLQPAEKHYVKRHSIQTADIRRFASYHDICIRMSCPTPLQQTIIEYIALGAWKQLFQRSKWN